MNNHNSQDLAKNTARQKYNQAELEPLIKQEMRSNGWQSDVIPSVIQFGIGTVHKCGKDKEFGYTAGDGCVFLYNYRNGGTEPIKINYSDLGVYSTSMTSEEIAEADRKAEAEEQKRQEQIEKATTQANEFYNKLVTFSSPTEYSTRKRINLFNGIRSHGTDIIIPFRNIEGQLTTIQTITSNGQKRWFPGAIKQGSFYALDGLELAIQTKIYICEGYATAASIYEALGICTVMVGDSSNIAEAVKNIRGKYPDLEIIICADDDWWDTKKSCERVDNPGRKYAIGAAGLWKCSVVFPDVHSKFMDDAKTKPATDFNDVHVMFGFEEVKKQIANVESVKKAGTPIADGCHNVMTLKNFLALKLPPQEPILGLWLRKKSLNMVYAWRGVGKTLFALNLSYAIASGNSFLGWKAHKPRGVLYVDGEMPANSMQERLAKIVASSDASFDDELFRLCTIDMQNGFMPDLGTPAGQQAVDRMIEPTTEVIIIDNISCLVRSGGKENDAESWLSIAEWAMAKRSQGLAVIFVHHAAKGGQQRGTSKREDILDVVIALKHPADYDPKAGACFEVHFEKSRHLAGKDVQAFLARLIQEGSRQKWEIKLLQESNQNRIIELHTSGLSNAEIAEEIGVHKSTVGRALDKAKKEGKISPVYKGKR